MCWGGSRIAEARGGAPPVSWAAQGGNTDELGFAAESYITTSEEFHAEKMATDEPMEGESEIEVHPETQQR